MSGLKYVPFYFLVLNISPLFIGLKYVSLKDVGLKDVSLKDVVVPFLATGAVIDLLGVLFTDFRYRVD